MDGFFYDFDTSLLYVFFTRLLYCFLLHNRPYLSGSESESSAECLELVRGDGMQLATVVHLQLVRSVHGQHTAIHVEGHVQQNQRHVVRVFVRLNSAFIACTKRTVF